MKKSAVRGPRPGKPDTREAIRLVARERFLADGFRSVTMRGIAQAAGVDVALVSYYFGSKRGVFGAAMSVQANPAEIVEQVLKGDRENLAERLLRTFLSAWDDPVLGAQLKAVAAAAVTEPDLGRVLREFVEHEIIGQLAEKLGGPAARRRAAAFSTQISGVVFSRYLLAVEPTASMSIDELVAELLPALERTLQPQ
jgi:AcrR family transcriptional regulator